MGLATGFSLLQLQKPWLLLFRSSTPTHEQTLSPPDPISPADPTTQTQPPFQPLP